MIKSLATKNVAAVALGIGLVLALTFSFATPAKAVTIEELQMQIQTLLAQIAALQGGTGSQQVGGLNCGTTFTRNLTMGSTGSEVMAVQQFLNSVDGAQVSTSGAGSPGNETSYFGALTQAAVSQFQAKYGITPTAGYWGPISRSQANSLCAAAPTTPTTPTTPGTPTSPVGLQGVVGNIDDVNTLGAYNNEQVAENQNDVKILGAEIEVSNDGDVGLTSVKISFDPTGNSGSDRLDKYVDKVHVWLGSTKIGSADASDFSEDSSDIWSKTIVVSNAVIRADQTMNLYISIDSVNSIDSADLTDSWTVGIDNIRFVDGSGVTTTDSSTGDLGDAALTITAAGTGGVGVDFVAYSTAVDTELKVSTATDSPEAGIVVIDTVSNTDDVSLLKGTLKLDGVDDVTLDELPVTLTVAGTAADVDTVTGSITLKIGGNTYSETVTTSTVTTASITFDNMNFKINAGQSVSFEILADIEDIESGTFDEGDTLTASVTASNRNLMDLENAQGDKLNKTTERSGTATGEAQEFRSSGIQLGFVSASTAVTQGNSTDDDLGTFTIRYTVTAVGDTVYISSLADALTSGNTDGKTSVHPDRAGTATVGGTSVTLTNLTDSDLTSVGLFQIEEGETHTFEVTTTIQLPTAGTAGQYRVVLGGVRWTITSTDSTPSNSYTSNLDNFKTSYIGMN